MPHQSKPVRAASNVVTECRAMAVRMPATDPSSRYSTMNDSSPESEYAYCCLPNGCPHYYEELICVSDPGDAVKVFCNNDSCTMGNWMHADCFVEWEQHVLNYLRSCGRARSWSEKQRHQNLWTKKGYDLAFKACACKCGRGHLRQDLSYTPQLNRDGDKKRKQKRREKPTSPGKQIMSVQVSSSREIRPSLQQLRIHRSSVSSSGSGSSPPSSAGTTPPSGGGLFIQKKNRFDFFTDLSQAAMGNIFQHRTDLATFSCLPRSVQNAYHIKMEDDGPHGNDETRCFVLTNLSSLQVTSVCCAVCEMDMPVYDKYPLIDGTFFLSPMRYTNDIRVVSDGRQLFMNAVCMRCMTGARMDLRCLGCRTPWRGANFVVGTMYSYDIFAALPCCAGRLMCKGCRQPIITPDNPMMFFSEYSHRIQCPYCKMEDHHFVKPLVEIFMMKRL